MLKMRQFSKSIVKGTSGSIAFNIFMKKNLLLVVLAMLLLTGCKQRQEVTEVIDLPRTEAPTEVVAAVDSFVNATQTRPVAPDSIALHSIMILNILCFLNTALYIMN